MADVKLSLNNNRLLLNLKTTNPSWAYELVTPQSPTVLSVPISQCPMQKPRVC